MSSEAPEIRIPGYRILKQLGRGGMASVYLAIQESMEREVALKIMLPSLGAADPSFSERFIREAKIVARLSHPHVNSVFDVGVAGPYHFFSMEYITGGDLKSRIHNGMVPRAALAIIRQVASALAYAHSKGYVHRDVKPENVLFRENGTAVLTDFGIAKASDNATQMTATGAVIGTPHYMSPEQAMGRETDRRSDIYSLGVMLFEMLTGHVPYTGTSAISIGIRHLKDPIPVLPPPYHVYQPLLNKFLAKEAGGRFQNGEEAIAAVDALSSGADSAAAAATVVTGAVALDKTVVFGPGLQTGDTRPTALTDTPRKGRGLKMAAMIIVPLVAVGLFFVLRKPAPVPVAAPAPESPAPTAAAPTIPAPPPAVTEDMAGKVAALLAEADAAAAAGRIFEPDESSAVRKYQQAIAMEPGNARATQALHQIASQIIVKAERAMEKKAFDVAEALLKQAETVEPAHPTLFSRRLALDELREKAAATAREKMAATAKAPVVTARLPPEKPRPAAEPPRPAVKVASAEEIRAREAQEREQRLQGALARLQELLAPGSLSAARVGLAEEMLIEATRLAPNDARVKSAPAQIAEAYLRMATTKAEQKEYKEAESLVRKGLEQKSDYRPLLALQKDIAERQKPKRQTFGSF
jgi:tetratricopeptide (TPR) repeat protein